MENKIQKKSREQKNPKKTTRTAHTQTTLMRRDPEPSVILLQGG